MQAQLCVCSSMAAPCSLRLYTVSSPPFYACPTLRNTARGMLGGGHLCSRCPAPLCMLGVMPTAASSMAADASVVLALHRFARSVWHIQLDGGGRIDHQRLSSAMHAQPRAHSLWAAGAFIISAHHYLACPAPRIAADVLINSALYRYACSAPYAQLDDLLTLIRPTHSVTYITTHARL